jgi:hypothetical protein
MTAKLKANSVLAALMLPIACWAQDWRDGDAPFKPLAKHPSQLAVSWVIAPSVQATCEAESKRRGLGGFGYGVAACSFWSGTTCTIVTSKTPTQHELGHELRHCFEYNWHP